MNAGFLFVAFLVELIMHFSKDLYPFVNAIKNGGLVIVFFLGTWTCFSS